MNSPISSTSISLNNGGQVLQPHTSQDHLPPLHLLPCRPQVRHHRPRRGTTIHCWVPKTYRPSLPNLVLIHGIGSNALWQWGGLMSRFTRDFNVYAPDLVFFGESYTTGPERTESFQARCVAGIMEAHGVRTMHVAGLSYGGIVAYSLAVQFHDRVLCCAGVSMDEKDMDERMFPMRSVDETVILLSPLTPIKAKEMISISVMFTEHLKERAEVIHALHKDRKMSNLPKITQPTLMIWGEHDKIFPLELAHRLKRHLDDMPRLVMIKDAGHILSLEVPTELYKHMTEFLLKPLASSTNHGNGKHKAVA